MQRHLPLCCLGLQQAHPIGLDADEAPQVALSCDILSHEPADLAGAHTREQPEEQSTVQHPVLGAEEDTHLCVRQHAVGVYLWPVLHLEGCPGVCLQLTFPNTPFKELGHLLQDTRLGLGCQRGALLLLGERCELSQACL